MRDNLTGWQHVADEQRRRRETAREFAREREERNAARHQAWRLALAFVICGAIACVAIELVIR